MNNDIFEDMFDLLKCEYLSDLHFKDIQVFQKLKTSNYENYTLLNLKDFFQYVFQIEIHSYEDIKKFLNQETMEETKWEKETFQLSLDWIKKNNNI